MNLWPRQDIQAWLYYLSGKAIYSGGASEFQGIYPHSWLSSRVGQYGAIDTPLSIHDFNFPGENGSSFDQRMLTCGREHIQKGLEDIMCVYSGFRLPGEMHLISRHFLLEQLVDVGIFRVENAPPGLTRDFTNISVASMTEETFVNRCLGISFDHLLKSPLPIDDIYTDSRYLQHYDQIKKLADTFDIRPFSEFRTAGPYAYTYDKMRRVHSTTQGLDALHILAAEPATRIITAKVIAALLNKDYTHFGIDLFRADPYSIHALKARALSILIGQLSATPVSFCTTLDGGTSTLQWSHPEIIDIRQARPNSLFYRREPGRKYLLLDDQATITSKAEQTLIGALEQAIPELDGESVIVMRHLKDTIRKLFP